MSVIGPGSILICVDATVFPGAPVQLVFGARYEVERLHDYMPHLGDPTATWMDCAVDLVGVPGPAADLAWGLYRFAPADGDQLAQTLKQPAPEPERENADA